MTIQTFDFDIALSFAGEDRIFVQRIAALLQDTGVRIFYDEYAAADLWGRDLYAALDDVYRKRARFTVAFISRHYVSKPWTQHERMSAQARGLTESDPYFLPVKLDDSELPGLRPTIGYVDARQTTQEALVELIKKKLAETPGTIKLEAPVLRVPRTPDQQRELLAQRPDGWEYLLYGGALWLSRGALEEKWRDHELGYADRTGKHYQNDQAITLLQNSLEDLRAYASNVMKLLTPEVQLRAFSAPGEPGNPELIEHIARRLVGIYEQMMSIASTLRGSGVSAEMREVMEVTAQLTDLPLRQIRNFIDRLVAEFDNIPELAARNEPLHIEMDLILSIDEEVLEAQAEAMRKAQRQLGISI